MSNCNSDCRFIRQHWDYEIREQVFDGCGYINDSLPFNLRDMNMSGYVATDANGKALRAVQGFISGSLRDLYLFGDPGVGKTHLLASAYNAMSKDTCPRVFGFHNVARLLKIERDEFQTRDEAEDELLSTLSRKHVLFLDDMCAESATGRTREFLYLLLNDAIERGAPRLFITGNMAVSWISKNISDRIGSRMAGIFGKHGVIKVGGVDHRLE